MTHPKPERLYSWEAWQKADRDAKLAGLAYLCAVGCAFADDGLYPAEAANPIPPELEEAWRKRGEL